MLYGRKRQCAQVDGLLEGSRDGRSGALVIRGEAGIGKTALLTYAAQRAEGMRVLTCAGIETESQLPYAGLHRLIRPLRQQIGALPPRQGAALAAAFGVESMAAEHEFVVSLAVLGLLADASPVVCLVDDAQWLDTASADALTFAARRIDAEGVVLLFAARDDPLRTFAAPGLPELHLAGLDAASASALLAQAADGPVADDVRDRLVADTLGNPLGLAEITASLTPDQRAGRTPLPPRLPVGREIEQVFVDRVRRLPPDSQTALLVAAAADTGDTGVVLGAARVLGVGPEAFDPAEGAELVSLRDGTVSFRHPLARSAVYHAATAAARRGVQRALATVLDTEQDADRRAWHQARAAIGADEQVAEALDGVARRARQRGAHAAAWAAAERAAALTSAPEPTAARLVGAAEGAWLAGHPENARELLDRAAPLTGSMRLRGRMANLRGSIEATCGAPTAAYATLVGGAEPIADIDPPRAARMLAEAGQIAWGTGDLSRLTEAGRRLAALPETGNPAAAAVIGLGDLLRGDMQAASAALHHAAELARSGPDPLSLMLPAMGAMFVGDDRRAVDLLTRGVELARTNCAVAMLPTLLAPLATLEAWTSRFTAATANAGEGLRLATEIGQDNPAAHARSVLAWVAGVQGRDQECAQLAESALSHAIGQRLGPHAAIASWALAVLDLGRGRPEAAADRLDAMSRAAPGEGHRMVSLFAAADLVEAASRAGRADAAAAGLTGLRIWADHVDSAWARALVARCTGILASPEDAESHFEEALTLHSAGGRPFDTARTALLYGEHLRRRRRRARARTHLRSAHETFARLGAAPWADKARAELEATGETARKRDVHAADTLTPQELQIARFVSQGATNRAIASRLFLSPRTVDYHLHKVFTKLGLGSRAELTRMMIEDGGQDPAT